MGEIVPVRMFFKPDGEKSAYICHSDQQYIILDIEDRKKGKGGARREGGECTKDEGEGRKRDDTHGGVGEGEGEGEVILIAPSPRRDLRIMG